MQEIFYGLITGSIYVLVAAGLTIVFGVLKIPNFAHGQSYMIGAFIAFYLTYRFQLQFIVALLITMVIVALLGAAIERITFRPLRGKPYISMLIVAVAVMIFLENFASLMWGNYARTIKIGGGGTIDIWGVPIPSGRFIVFILAVIIIVGLQAFLKWTKPGQAIRAMGQNLEAAQLVGVNVNKMTSFTFGLTSALAAGAGALLATIFSLDPHMGLGPLLKAVVIIVLGGMGSIVGAIVGGFGLGVVESLGSIYLSSAYKDSIAFIFLITVLLIKPSGFFGSNEEKE